MSYTFQKAHGGNVGKSLVEDDYLEYAKEMMEKAEKKGVKLLIPIDTVVTKEFKNDTPSRIVAAGHQKMMIWVWILDLSHVNSTRMR